MDRDEYNDKVTTMVNYILKNIHLLDSYNKQIIEELYNELEREW